MYIIHELLRGIRIALSALFPSDIKTKYAKYANSEWDILKEPIKIKCALPSSQVSGLKNTSR